MVASSSKFYGKIWVGFHIKANRKSIGFSLNGARDFQNSPPFERSACFFMRQSLKILNVFNTLTLKQIFWKAKTFFKKLEHDFLVENIMTENALFPYKTAISEANDKANKMVTTKWTNQKERSFASNYLITFRKRWSLI